MGDSTQNERAQPQSAQPRASGEQRVCPDCGARLGAEVVFCPTDGSFVGTPGQDSSDSLLGATVAGGFRVLKVCGEGGVSVVYKVKALEGSSLAMKVLREDLCHDSILRERFSREAHATSRVSHPNLVSVVGVGTLDGPRPYILMEFLEGETLADYRARHGRVSVRAVVDIARQIASALEALHEIGVLHRDLKPANVYVAEELGRLSVKLFDLGLAHVAAKARITLPGIVHGTAHYMAPEQALGELLDPRTDVYALGVVMYELVSGAVPFPGRSYARVLDGHVSEPPPPLTTGTPPPELERLSRIVMKCLRKNAGERYGSVAELDAALSELAGHLPPSGP